MFQQPPHPSKKKHISWLKSGTQFIRDGVNLLIYYLLLKKPAKYPTPTVISKYFFFQIVNHSLYNQLLARNRLNILSPETHYFPLTKQNFKIKWITIEPFTPISSLRAVVCRILWSSHYFPCCNWSCILILKDVNCRLIRVRALCPCWQKNILNYFLTVQKYSYWYFSGWTVGNLECELEIS